MSGSPQAHEGDAGQERGRLAFLARASRLLAQSLDYEQTLLSVASLALPFLGSWCIVDIVEPDASIRRLAIIHPDSAKQALAEGLKESWPPAREDPLGAPRALLTRCVEVIPHVDDAMLVSVARSTENLALLRVLGIGSVIVVPLIVRERVLGALTLVSSRAEHVYADVDLDLAEDLGRRCATAIDHARLYRDEQAARERAIEVNQALVVATLREQALADDARRASEAKSQFLAALSHEVRTPINAIMGYTDLLEMKAGSRLTEAERLFITRIRTSTAHVMTLIGDVLDLAKVEAGRLSVEPAREEASHAISSAVVLVEPQAAAASVSVRVEGCPADVYYGDEHRVLQILVNLLTNAVKFTGPGGAVTITCEVTSTPDAEARLEPGSWLCMRVTDTGIGIPDAMKALVFEPFVQASQGHTRTHTGTGLGLTISRELARLMGGDLTLRDGADGGSCFTLWLPTST